MTEEDTAEAITQKISNDVHVLSGEVSKYVAIFNVRLTSIEARLQAFGDEMPVLSRISRRHGTARNDEKEELHVNAQFEFEMAHDTDESKLNPPIKISAVFSLAYRVPDIRAFDDEHLDAFAEVNGVHNAWPFWRELVNSTMGRMGLPSFTMPSHVVSSEESDPDSD